METTVLVIGTFLVLFVTYSSQYSTGAPPSACSTITPGHGGSSQPIPGGFFLYSDLIDDGGSYTASTAYTVILEGPSDFRGFLIQARTSGTTTPIGAFSTPSGTKHLLCSGVSSASVTHESANDKSNLTFTWTSPSNTGTVEFRYAVVVNFNTYYANISASDYRPLSSSSSSNVATSTPVPAPSLSSSSMDAQTSTLDAPPPSSSKPSSPSSSSDVATSTPIPATSSSSSIDTQTLTLVPLPSSREVISTHSSVGVYSTIDSTSSYAEFSSSMVTQGTVPTLSAAETSSNTAIIVGATVPVVVIGIAVLVLLTGLGVVWFKCKTKGKITERKNNEAIVYDRPDGINLEAKITPTAPKETSSIPLYSEVVLRRPSNTTDNQLTYSTPLYIDLKQVSAEADHHGNRDNNLELVTNPSYMDSKQILATEAGPHGNDTTHSSIVPVSTNPCYETAHQ